MLENRKISSYLFYAVGEITLVMIGILLALQVNNWNENRKSRAEEIDLFQNIIADLDFDSNRIEVCLEELYSQLSVVDKMIEDIKDPDRTMVHEKAGFIRWQTAYYPKTKNNHEEKVSSIKNNSARKAIQEYFSTETLALDVSAEYTSVIYNQLRPYMIENGMHNFDALYTEEFDGRADIILNASILDSQLKNMHFQQILFERRFKTKEYINYLDVHLKANKTLAALLHNIVTK